MTNVTQILAKIERGDPAAAEQLLPLVYDELRKLAAARLSHEPPGQTLQPTALVHEAYVRLVDVEQARPWDSRGHFFAAAAESMRRIIVESIRRKRRLKRGGDLARVDIDPMELPDTAHDDRLLAIDEALEKLAVNDPRAATLVKLRFYAGMSITEAADALGISRTSAYEEWSYARAWLRTQVECE